MTCSTIFVPLKDWIRTIDFYENVLDFDLVSRNLEQDRIKFQCGLDGFVELCAIPGELQSVQTQIIFYVYDLATVRQELASKGVEFRSFTEPSLNEHAAPRLLFCDPAGNELSIAAIENGVQH